MTAHEILDRRVYHTGELIFREGESGRRCAFLVENGKIEISKNSPSGAKILGYVTTGGIFGEMALVDAAPRMAQAKAAETSTVVVITETQLETRLRRSDPFIRALFNIFVKNIRDLTERIVELQK